MGGWPKGRLAGTYTGKAESGRLAFLCTLDVQGFILTTSVCVLYRGSGNETSTIPIYVQGFIQRGVGLEFPYPEILKLSYLHVTQRKCVSSKCSEILSQIASEAI